MAAPNKLDANGSSNVEGRSHQKSEYCRRGEMKQELQKKQPKNEYKRDARNDPGEIENPKTAIA